MFGERIAQETANHLRSHISAYLAEVNDQFTAEVTLVVPKSIEVASVVGGMFTEYDSILPQYGIDVLNKVFLPEGLNLFTYQYEGQINGLVHGNSQAAVDHAIKRHAAAVELFLKRHEVLHELNTDNFSIVGMYFQTVQFSGAEDLGEVEGTQTWVAAFSLDLVWVTSENGPGQHA